MSIRVSLGGVFLAVSLTAHGARAQSPVASSSSGADSTRQTWGWIATGSGAAFLGVGIYSFVKSANANDDEAYDEYRTNEVPKGESACDWADSHGRQDIVELCEDSKTYKTVFMVATPIGLLLTGTGIYLLATSGQSKDTGRLTVAPAVGPRAGRIDLNYRF